MAAFLSGGALGRFVDSASAAAVDTAFPIELADAGYSTEDIAGDMSPEYAFTHQPAVRKVTSFIARNVASIPLHVYSREGDTDRRRVTNGPIASVLQAPAAGMTPMRFWRAVFLDLLLRDRFCVTAHEKNGALVLTRLPARRVKFRSDEFGNVRVVRYTTRGGEVIEFDAADCIYEVGYSPRGSNGLSPIDTLREILAESSEAVAYRRSVWKNAARIPQVIERPAEAGKWTDEGWKRFSSQWTAFKRGGGNEGGTPILEDGMTVKEVTSFRPKDTLDLEGRKLTDAEVASAYFIAPELVGAREGTYSNIESFRQMLYRDALGPWITIWEQALNSQLVPRWNGGRPLYVEANIESKLRGSFEESARILQASTGAPWLTRNEARARANLPAIDGADELVTPLNVIEGGQASPQDSAPPPT
ncbi:phage portal protein [Rhodococcus cerastii]|uniref:Phage portal protein n=1 Tax=Rhodococcus cerastii TaxID=908616 RepID=A0ABU4D559_9NOCA|nr:phage portal protein [Rhodococcus cerastii]MDV6304858.1 phage portal protein [Rhodococcus cerastii]